jgi:bacterioferritin
MNIEDIKFKNFAVDKPYPKVTTNSNDVALQNRILNAYTGRHSELTCVNQYIYQSFITNTPNAQSNLNHLSNLLMEIAKVEMHHLRILAKILVSMGANPKFCTHIDNNDAICNYWSGSYVKYITSIPDFLKQNIEDEKGAVKDYTSIIESTNDTNIKEVLARIIEDEKSHIAIFTAILELL